jgi:hypothetical protein
MGSAVMALDMDASHCLNGNLYLSTEDGPAQFYFVLVKDSLCYVELGDDRHGLEEDDVISVCLL